MRDGRENRCLIQSRVQCVCAYARRGVQATRAVRCACVRACVVYAKRRSLCSILVIPVEHEPARACVRSAAGRQFSP